MACWFAAPHTLVLNPGERGERWLRRQTQQCHSKRLAKL
jgi:hypothetical protein